MLKTSKRRSERILTNLGARMMDEEDAVDVTITDINAHGMFVRTQCTDVIGGIRRFEIALPDGTQLELIGVVRFCGATVAGAGMGIELGGMPHITQARWNALYEALLPDGGGTLSTAISADFNRAQLPAAA
jgi:hypothetical protein